MPIDPWTLQLWEPAEGKEEEQTVKIAGVPEREIGVEVEMPIELGEGGEGSGLVTGRVKDVVQVDGMEVRLTLSENDRLAHSNHPESDPCLDHLIWSTKYLSYSSISLT